MFPCSNTLSECFRTVIFPILFPCSQKLANVPLFPTIFCQCSLVPQNPWETLNNIACCRGLMWRGLFGMFLKLVIYIYTMKTVTISVVYCWLAISVFQNKQTNKQTNKTAKAKIVVIYSKSPTGKQRISYYIYHLPYE